MDDQDIEYAFWQQVLEDSRLAIMCPPVAHDELVDLLTQVGMADRFDIVSSSWVEEGHYVVIDVNGLDAYVNSMMQHDWDLDGTFRGDIL